MENTEQDTTHALSHASRTRAVIIGVLALALVLIFIALYLWGTLLTTAPAADDMFVAPPNHEPETPRADADIQILKTVSSSDEISSIDADLGSTNLESLDKELDLIDRDLGN